MDNKERGMLVRYVAEHREERNNQTKTTKEAEASFVVFLRAVVFASFFM